MKLKSVVPAHDGVHKYEATFVPEAGRTKHTKFGATGMDDYTKTHDKEQRARYIERHGRGRETWSDPTSAGALSRYILWGESTSMLENLRRYRSRFNL
jgi:hypothetical protein